MEENLNVENSNSDTVDTGAEKTFTEEEVLKLIQKEADKRVTSALKKQQAKFEKQQSEAEKLRNMDETQRKEYEFEQRVKQFEAKEREFTINQNKLEATKVMAERKLPIQFVDYIVAEDAETMMENINTFETQFKAAVSDAVTARIGTGTPKGGAVKQTGITKEQFKKMTLAQQSELYKTNPTLYKELSHR